MRPADTGPDFTPPAAEPEDGLAARVRANYGGGTLARILGLVEAAGIPRERMRHDDLKRFDSLHLGGWQATEALLDGLGVAPGAEALDIGCGVGGVARMLAMRHGARVEGIDLTPEFVAAAAELSRLAGVEGVAFRVASATALPFPAERFDLATMLHVGMNVPDKAALFGEAARVLRPGSRFGVFDVMRTGPGEVRYPMLWAGEPGISFLESPERYAALAAATGLRETARRSRAEEGVRFLEALRETPGRGMPTDRLANTLDALGAGVLAPVEMIFVKE
jgi:SAM-dependent methyltransferase